jgi:hypothetical protein
MNNKIRSRISQLDYKVIAALETKILKLESLLNLVHKDLLMRAEEDHDGYKVVDLSSSIWMQINEVINKRDINLKL